MVGRIYDYLVASFGEENVDRDVESVPPGADVPELIEKAIGQCDVVLAVIGKKWAGKTSVGRKIDDPEDFVRIELESALELKHVRVMPILIDRAQRPRAADLPPSLARLARLNAHDIDQGQYQRVMGDNASHFDELHYLRRHVFRFDKGSGDLPVKNVSWFDAVAFCNKLSEREKLPLFYRIDGTEVTILGGEGYRLPAEAEWEYARRAGSSTLYPFGDDAALLGEFTWYNKNSEGEAHAVGQRRPNAWGLHDILGNIFEWCHDCYEGKYDYSSSPADPTGAAGGPVRVIRGGGWAYCPDCCRPAYRSRYSPVHRSSHIGFRVARDRASPAKRRSRRAGPSRS